MARTKEEKKAGIESYKDWSRKQITPEAIVCTRGITNYDAEISFRGEHYVVSLGHKNHAEAKASAQRLADEMIRAMDSVARAFLVGLKHPKP